MKRKSVMNIVKRVKKYKKKIIVRKAMIDTINSANNSKEKEKEV